MLPFSELNYAAVVLAFIANVAIGFTWYSPKVFGTRWMQLVGMTKEKAVASSMGKAMAIGFSASFLRVLILALLLSMLSPSTMGEAILLSIVLWLGFVATIELDGVAWEHRPVELLLINAGMACVGTVVAAAILFAMG